MWNWVDRGICIGWCRRGFCCCGAVSIFFMVIFICELDGVVLNRCWLGVVEEEVVWLFCLISKVFKNELIFDVGRVRLLDGVLLVLFFGFMLLLLVVLVFDADEELDVIDEVGVVGVGVLVGIGVYIFTVYFLLKVLNVYNALLYFFDFFLN